MDDKRLSMLGDHEAQERFTDRGELLPCPCCGGDADCWEDTGNRKGVVQCVDCELTIQSTSKEAAIREWNTRAPILSFDELKRLKETKQP